MPPLKNPFAVRARAGEGDERATAQPRGPLVQPACSGADLPALLSQETNVLAGSAYAVNAAEVSGLNARCLNGGVHAS
jgi:hypothetical protein